MEDNEVVDYARHHGREQTRQWFWTGGGQPLRTRLVQKGMRLLSSRHGADSYVDSIYVRAKSLDVI